MGDSGEGLLKEDVRDIFLNTWLDVHDDIRWFFLREAGYAHSLLLDYAISFVGRSLLAKPGYPNVPINILALLEKLSTFPTDTKELNSWWVEELGTKPPSPKGKKGKGKGDSSEDEDDTPEEKPAEDSDDWRRFFDEPSADAKDKGKEKQKTARVHTLTLHQSLHSLASHRAVFTRCWLGLLPRLSSTAVRDRDGREVSRGYALRVLNILHRGVLPHLTRPVLVMDWVGGCVDYGAFAALGDQREGFDRSCPGGTVGLLALNALFTLIKDYNLYASRFSIFPLFLMLCIQGLPLLLHASLRVP